MTRLRPKIFVRVTVGYLVPDERGDYREDGLVSSEMSASQRGTSLPDFLQFVGSMQDNDKFYRDSLSTISDAYIGFADAITPGDDGESIND